MWKHPLFGSEFVAMRIATEQIRIVRCKLRSFGIPINEPTFVYGDNKSVLKNCTLPQSTLKKKSNAIAYHYVIETETMGETIHGYFHKSENADDLLTKPLSRITRDKHVQTIMYDIT